MIFILNEIEITHFLRVYHVSCLMFQCNSYGPGPFHVEVYFESDGLIKTFKVETAPNKAMPHAIYTFLEMIQNKIWDNTIFVHNSEHIVSAAIVDPMGEPKEGAEDYELAYRESYDGFQHERFTVSFDGLRPVFYINLADNRERYGPGGTSLAVSDGNVMNDADPCFAKVVDGRDNILLLEKKSSDAVSSKSRYAFSKIERVRLVK